MRYFGPLYHNFPLLLLFQTPSYGPELNNRLISIKKFIKKSHLLIVTSILYNPAVRRSTVREYESGLQNIVCIPSKISYYAFSLFYPWARHP